MYDFHFGTKNEILSNPEEFLIFTKRLLPRWINGIPDSECLAIFHSLEHSKKDSKNVIIETGCGASTLAMFLWCTINKSKLFSWDTNGSKGSFLRGVILESIARPLEVNVYDIWTFIPFDSTNKYIGIEVLKEMDLQACYGYFDSWHTLDHLVNEIESFEKIACSEFIIALDDAYYTKKYENLSYINMIRNKLNLNKISDTDPKNKSKPFYLEIEKMLSKKYTVKHLDDFYKSNYKSDIFFEYYKSDKKAMNKFGMEISDELEHRFDIFKVVNKNAKK